LAFVEIAVPKRIVQNHTVANGIIIIITWGYTITPSRNFIRRLSISGTE
jgi:hypothetical protein